MEDGGDRVGSEEVEGGEEGEGDEVGEGGKSNSDDSRETGKGYICVWEPS